MRCPSEPSLRAGAFHDWLGTQGGSGVTASLNSGRKRSVIGSEEPRAEVPCRACRHYGRKLSARAGLGSGRAAEARCRNEGRSSSPPLGPPRGLSPSEGGAAAEGRKAAAGVLQSQVSQEKEQADCPGSCACVWLVLMAGVDDRSRAPKLLVLMLDLPLGKGRHPVRSAFLPYHLVYRRKTLSREMEKEFIIPLPHPVRPEDGEYEFNLPCYLRQLLRNCPKQ
ncbi:uncharacterized protein [Anser cygnoides]|uniref:uncharacterized protein isoform X9 n=1 Tax=Anser cygnoides TaxID=8845 RepID=UPI0034D29686